MAKRTIRRTETAADVKKTVATPKKAGGGEITATGPRAARAARAPEFLPPTAEEVAVRAYFRAKERGSAPGNAMEDWLAAEAELIAWRQSAAQDAKPATRAASRKKVERATGIEPV
jgi:hypothetical protein